MPNKKLPVFRVVQTLCYLNLLVKPRIFFDFLKKSIILCILRGILFSKCIKLNSRKKIIKKYACILYLKFSDLLLKTYFILGSFEGSRRAHRMGLEPASVLASTLSSMNISLANQYQIPSGASFGSGD